jgi:mannose-1-phosphate guanylyltransferase
MLRKSTKEIFNKGAFLYSSRHFSTFLAKSSYSTSKIWNEMNEIEKINSAMATSEPKNSEVAFYKGVGHARLGEENAEQALYYLEKAIEDPKYRIASTTQMAGVYYKLGLYKKSADILLGLLDNKNNKEHHYNQEEYDNTDNHLPSIIL